MAMTMNGEYELPVPPQTVWEKLNDAATLKACIPGCEQLDHISRRPHWSAVLSLLGRHSSAELERGVHRHGPRCSYPGLRRQGRYRLHCDAAQ